MWFNTRERYGLVAQLLHWATAVLVVVMLVLGVFMQQLPAASAGEAAAKYGWFSLHKTLGIVTFCVALARVVWAALQPAPALLNAERRLEAAAARTVHWLLYGAILVMPLTGWLHHAASEGFAPILWPLSQDLPFVPKDAWLASLFAAAHHLTAILLAAALTLHVAGALKHALVDRDDTLRRMIPGLAPTSQHALPEQPAGRMPLALAILAFAAVGIASVLTHGPSTPAVPGANRERTAETATPATASGWRVDYARSRLAIRVMQSETPVDGSFGRWQARIDFDPDDLAAARIEVNVDIASLALGGVSEDAKSDKFLNAAVHPTAQFVSRNVVKTGANTYAARGALTLAGQTHPLTLGFSLDIAGERATAKATATIDRLTFGVGAAGFPGGGLVGIKVEVSVMLEADRATAQ